MNDRSGDGTGSFEVKIRTKTAKFTNMIIARLRERERADIWSEKVRCSSKIKPRLRADVLGSKRQHALLHFRKYKLSPVGKCTDCQYR